MNRTFTLSSIYRFYKKIASEIYLDKTEVSTNVIDEENKLISILDSEDLYVNIDLNSNVILTDKELGEEIDKINKFLREYNFFYLPLIFDTLQKGFIFLKESGGNHDGTKYIIAKTL